MASGEMSNATFVTFLTSSLHLAATWSVNGSIHFICMDWRHINELQSAGEQVYSELKNLIVWVKDNAGMGSFYRSRHELIFAFKNGTEPHINAFELGQNGRYRTNVWHYRGATSPTRETRQALALHPTVKPVAMVVDALKDCSRRGGIVLDPFCGSGTIDDFRSEVLAFPNGAHDDQVDALSQLINWSRKRKTMVISDALLQRASLETTVRQSYGR